MQGRISLTLAASFLAGCGYVGDPLPPALNIPQKITDLRSMQRGGVLVIEFTAPALTTESLPIRSFEAVEVRVGEIPNDFSFPAWASAAKQVPAAGEPAKPVHLEAPVAGWVGREVLIGVRTSARPGRYSEWATVTARVQAALAVPANVRAEPHPEGVRVSWTAAGPGVSYRVYRDGAVAGTGSEPEFLDKGIALGKSYSYVVRALREGAESEQSSPATVTAVDRFAPRTPAGLAAIAGVSSIELGWERNTEADLRGYRVYRAAGSGEFTVIADAVEAPAYSDRQVTTGTKYRYAVSAVDQTGNESERSTPLEALAP